MRRNLLLALYCIGCGAAPLRVEMPLHLEDHLAAAHIEGAQSPPAIPATVEWRFSEPQPDWKPAIPMNRSFGTALVERTPDALRVTLPEGRRHTNGALAGGVYIDLPDWRANEWADVVVRARRKGDETSMYIGVNHPPRDRAVPENAAGFQVDRTAGRAFLVRNGSVQTYQIRLAWTDSLRHAPWRRLGLWFVTEEPGSIDILSVSVVPTGAAYADAPVGLRSVSIAGNYRRTVFTRVPQRINYRVRVPEGGRLQVALGVERGDMPVQFRVVARPDRGDTATLLREEYADPARWAERTVDLSRYAGRNITLSLESSAATADVVAFWGSPTVSGSTLAAKPNVIFYVIDGAGADYMSVYGYNRRTTPNLEKLAAEGALFERVYSNAAWTKPSTTSFMTSLFTSVLGNTKGEKGSIANFDPLPVEAVTMAESFHNAGYQTGVFTSNPWAGTRSSLERGVDFLPEVAIANTSTSSVNLQDAFWNWREAYSGEPYWVHFQTTDVHQTFRPVAPFAGMFVPLEQERVWNEGREKNGMSVREFQTVRQGIYDQLMAHNDYQIGRLVAQLKASGEWENTILVIAADHSTRAIFGGNPALPDSLPAWNQPFFRPSTSRVPLIVVWPRGIKGGQRFADAVSMIDVMPTLLDLAGLPALEIAQGQSLAPLLRGEGGWKPRPVIIDDSDTEENEQLEGRLEVIDGRWAASMRIGPPPERESDRWPWPVIVYDLWKDPLAVMPINEQRPDLVKKYSDFLEAARKDHQALATRFTPGARVALTPEQLERLRTLGYIR